MLWAAKEGQIDVVKLLIKEGVDLDHLDDHDQTPLWWAVAKGNGTLVKWLLADAKIDPNKGESSLVHAAKHGSLTLVKVLLADDRIDPKAGGSENHTPLHWAAEKGYQGVVRLLLEDTRVDPDPQDIFGRTPS